VRRRRRKKRRRRRKQKRLIEIDPTSKSLTIYLHRLVAMMLSRVIDRVIEIPFL
jgi:hypothetical protein